MAKVGFNPLGLGAGAMGMSAGSDVGIGVAAGATVGWVRGAGGAKGAGSSIRLFFLHLPLKG